MRMRDQVALSYPDSVRPDGLQPVFAPLLWKAGDGSQRHRQGLLTHVEPIADGASYLMSAGRHRGRKGRRHSGSVIVVSSIGLRGRS